MEKLTSAQEAHVRRIVREEIYELFTHKLAPMIFGKVTADDIAATIERDHAERIMRGFSR